MACSGHQYSITRSDVIRSTIQSVGGDDPSFTNIVYLLKCNIDEGNKTALLVNQMLNPVAMRDSWCMAFFPSFAHDDIKARNRFRHDWPFVRGIHWVGNRSKLLNKQFICLVFFLRCHQLCDVIVLKPVWTACLKCPRWAHAVILRGWEIYLTHWDWISWDHNGDHLTGENFKAIYHFIKNNHILTKIK